MMRNIEQLPILSMLGLSKESIVPAIVTNMSPTKVPTMLINLRSRIFVNMCCARLYLSIGFR